MSGSICATSQLQGTSVTSYAGGGIMYGNGSRTAGGAADGGTHTPDGSGAHTAAGPAVDGGHTAEDSV